MSRSFVQREDLPADLICRHDELMDMRMKDWPEDLHLFLASGPPVTCGQALADRVGAWLAVRREVGAA